MRFVDVKEHMNFVVGDLSDRVPHNSTGSENLTRASGTPPMTQVWRNVSEKHRNAALAVGDFDLQSYSYCVCRFR